MIQIKNAKELDGMRRANALSAAALKYGGQHIEAGMTTWELDKLIYDFIVKHGGTPNFKGLYGFPGTACISLNDTIIHGIPSHDIVIRPGDIVSIDTGAKVDGFNGDNACTYAVGKIDLEAQRLLDVTKASLYKGIEQAVAGNRIGDIGYAVQSYCEDAGFSVVREFVGKENVSQYEFIPWVLSQCSSVKEVRSLLMRINLVGTPYSEMFPAAQLHWIIADENEAITVESVKEGLKVYDNHVGVLTNNPPFDIQMLMLADYAGLSPKQPVNTFASGVNLNMYSRGMGAMGLPGDLSSRSRFARVAYTKMNSRSGDSENESVSQFFHILGSVEQQRGCCEVADGKYEITIYTSCWNAAKGIYYYTTYENSQISAVDMNREDLESSGLKRYPLVNGQHINYQN